MLRKTLLASVIFILAQPVSASPSTTPIGRESLIPKHTDGVWYYEIGGAEYIPLPRIDQSRIRVGAGISWNGNLMCSNLNPDVSFDAFMNGAKQGWINMQRNAVSAVRGTVASLPGLALQHVDPGLYEMVSTGFIQAEKLFQIELADCRKITKDLSRSKPNFDWVSVSGYEGLRDYFNYGGGSPKTNINEDMGEMVKDAEEDAGKAGIDWVCGAKAGGDGQDPIRGSDVLIGAYNSMLGRSPCDKSSPSRTASSNPPTFLAYWSSPSEAKNWFKEVLGETEIYTSPTEKPLTKTLGIGLMPMVQKTKDHVHTKLDAIVSSSSEPTLEDLREVSFTDMLVTKDIVSSLKTDPYKDALISRMALDVALQREMSRALELRRMLVVGGDTEVVSGKEPSKKMVDAYVKRLSEEISMVSEEINIRKSLSSSTAPFILKRSQERNFDTLETVDSFNKSRVGG